MRFKYKSNIFLPARLTFLLLCFLSFSSHSQIVSGEMGSDDEIKEKPKKEKKEFERDSLNGTTYYLTGMYNYGHRSFTDNSPFNSYETWNDQTPGGSGGLTLGILMDLNDYISLDMGISYFGQKENYNFDDPDSDSTYFFSNTYMQLGVPIKLRFTTGDKIQFFGFVGLTPLNLLNVRFNESYNTKQGLSVISETELIKEKLSTFNVQSNAGFGLTYNLDWVGFTLYPEFRYNLINTYDPKSKPIEHKMFGLGVHAGLTLRF
jgi:Outer membrane protein beta-barrel domain